MERRPDGTLIFRLGQPLYQILIVLAVAFGIASMFLYGGLFNDKPLESGGEVWADVAVVNAVLFAFSLFAFLISAALLQPLLLRLAGRQWVRLEARRVVLEGLHRKGTLTFQYREIDKVELASMGQNRLVLVVDKEGKRMTVPVLLFRAKGDPQRLVAQLHSRMAEAKRPNAI